MHISNVNPSELKCSQTLKPPSSCKDVRVYLYKRLQAIAHPLTDLKPSPFYTAGRYIFSLLFLWS